MKKSIRATKAIAIVLAILPLFAGSSARADFCDSSYPPVGMKPFYEYEGLYENYAYGYAVELPKGVKGGLYQDPDAPQHGISVILNWDPRSEVGFSGEANSAEDDEGRPLSAQGHCLWYLSVVRKDATVISASEVNTTELGAHPASSITIRFSCSNKPGVWVTEYVAAVPKERGLLYEVFIQTVEDRYAQDRQVLRDIARSFRLIEWR